MASHLRVDLERDELAQRLGGGLPTEAVCVVAGTDGAGKSVLCQRLAHGALRHGARVAYVSTELGLRTFLAQMGNLGYPVEDDLLAGRLALHSTHPAAARAHPRPEHLRRLLASRVPEGRGLVVVDRASSLLRDARAGPDGPVAVDLAVEHFLRWARGGRTVVLAVDPADLDAGDLGALLRVANVFLELKTQLMGPQALHVAHVRRFERPLARVSDMFVFRVEPRVGLLLEIKAVY